MNNGEIYYENGDNLKYAVEDCEVIILNPNSYMRDAECGCCDSAREVVRGHVVLENLVKTVVGDCFVLRRGPYCQVIVTEA